VLAPDRLITGNPAAVKAFVEATAAGWKAYLEGDPAPGDKLILKDNPEMTEDVLAQARDKLRQYQVIGPGTMTDDRWAQFFKVASDGAHPVYPKTMDYKAAYTLAFLPPAK